MRKFLYGLMMLVMLTPALACGAALCAKKAHAAQGKTVHEAPCHEDKQDGSKDGGLMFFKDCMGIDLAQADHNGTLKKPDIQIDKVLYSRAGLEAGYSFLPQDSYLIRGPPTETAQARTYPPLYLTTQRLRI